MNKPRRVPAIFLENLQYEEDSEFEVTCPQKQSVRWNKQWVTKLAKLSEAWRDGLFRVALRVSQLRSGLMI